MNNRKKLLQKINRIYGDTKITKFIYESHMGGLYCTTSVLDDTYCETCGDSDWLLGSASSKPKAREVIRSSPLGDCWDRKYVERFLKDNW